MLPLFRAHARRAFKITAMASCAATAVCMVAAAPSRALCAPVAVPAAAPQTNTPQTPAAVDPLLIRKAITAKPACEGQANELHKKPFIIGVTGECGGSGGGEEAADSAL